MKKDALIAFDFDHLMCLPIITSGGGFLVRRIGKSISIWLPNDNHLEFLHFHGDHLDIKKVFEPF